MTVGRWGFLVLCAAAHSACQDRPEPSVSAAPVAPSSERAAPVPGDLWSDPPVDLLHAVRSELRVSSVYRDEVDQVGRLVDGDSETAWNSASDDLVGAWIEFTVPEGARVAEIQLSAGYTKRTERRDLFVGNHRIERVRVIRGSETVVEHALDVEDRGLQSVRIGGGGGRYRVEIAAVREGARQGWREVCVSEFRVMGQAANARPGAFTPTFAIGRSTGVDGLDDPAVGRGIDSWGEAGGPRLAVSDRRDCVLEGRGCLAHDGFPAISRDGRRLVVVTPRPFLLLGPTAEEETEWIFQTLATDGEVIETRTLVSETEVSRMLDVHADCCGDSEHDCDPYLCDEDPTRVAEASDALRSKAAETIGEAVQLVADAEGYRSLVRIDGSGAEGLTAEIHLAGGEARVVVRSDASKLVERSLPLDCEACVLAHSGVWFDPTTRRVAALAVGFDGTSEETHGGWLVLSAGQD